MATSQKTYKELERELSEVLSRIENGDYEELDMLLADYDKGIKLIESLEKKLATAKNSIKKVN